MVKPLDPLSWAIPHFHGLYAQTYWPVLARELPQIPEDTTMVDTFVCYGGYSLHVPQVGVGPVASFVPHQEHVDALLSKSVAFQEAVKRCGDQVTTEAVEKHMSALVSESRLSLGDLMSHNVIRLRLNRKRRQCDDPRVDDNVQPSSVCDTNVASTRRRMVAPSSSSTTEGRRAIMNRLFDQALENCKSDAFGAATASSMPLTVTNVRSAMQQLDPSVDIAYDAVRKRMKRYAS
jgi:hypothetical protein